MGSALKDMQRSLELWSGGAPVHAGHASQAH